MNTEAAEDMRRRGLVSIYVDYRSWMRYGDRDSRFRASTVAWVLTGSDYRIPLLNRAAADAARGRNASSTPVR